MIYLFLLAHLVADFLLQPYRLVVRKRYWDGLLIHGGIVMGCMFALALVDRRVLALWPIIIGITIIHVVADWWKVHRADRLFKPPIIPFMLDQFIHIATLIWALGLVLPAKELWTLPTNVIEQLALYGVAYVIAASAVPIAVMVWRDPSFNYQSLAAPARVRSMLIGVIVISLALFAQPIALPAILIGFVIVARRPASVHPLDTPTGVLVILFAAIIIGTTLNMMPV